MTMKMMMTMMKNNIMMWVYFHFDRANLDMQLSWTFTFVYLDIRYSLSVVILCKYLIGQILYLLVNIL